MFFVLSFFLLLYNFLTMSSFLRRFIFLLLMTLFKLACALIFVTITFSSCNIINPKEEIPAFIKIDTFVLNTNYLFEGSASHKITDVWINIDDNIQGIYELPINFPVLETGDRKITIRPGIRVNGISASRDIVPYFEHYIIEDNLLPGDTLFAQPQTSYKDATVFHLLEDFESAGSSIQITNKSDVNFVTSSDDNFQGYGSLMATIENVGDIFECSSIDSFYLPADARPVFLELDYKTNSTLVVGIIINKTVSTNKLPVIYLNPTEKWNKIYIKLTDFLTSNYDNTVMHYRIFFGAIRNEEDEVVKVYMDNIKLIHI
jgi:hypothetical protein